SPHVLDRPWRSATGEHGQPRPHGCGSQEAPGSRDLTHPFDGGRPDSRDLTHPFDGGNWYRPRSQRESDVHHRLSGLRLFRQARGIREEGAARRPGESYRHCLHRNNHEGELIMPFNKPIRRVAIVGTGVIGASWAAQYLARGFDVVATDPAPNAEDNLRKYVDGAWEQLTTIGLTPGASRERLSFISKMQDALTKSDFVQENAPERPEFKMKLFADMDDATPPDSIIASSSSGITPSVMQSKCKRPDRVLVGHPFNPPHIIPLVEVVAGTKTSPEAVQR